MELLSLEDIKHWKDVIHYHRPPKTKRPIVKFDFSYILVVTELFHMFNKDMK